jgi:hypothetical protein
MNYIIRQTQFSLIRSFLVKAPDVINTISVVCLHLPSRHRIKRHFQIHLQFQIDSLVAIPFKALKEFNACFIEFRPKIKERQNSPELLLKQFTR